jgi:hypothetical protein
MCVCMCVCVCGLFFLEVVLGVSKVTYSFFHFLLQGIFLSRDKLVLEMTFCDYGMPHILTGPHI